MKGIAQQICSFFKSATMNFIRMVFIFTILINVFLFISWDFRGVEEIYLSDGFILFIRITAVFSVVAAIFGRVSIKFKKYGGGK